MIWNIDPEDWKKPGTQKIADNAIQHAMPNGIILLHDGGGDRTQTVGALPIIIDNLKERGYTFITLCS